MPDSFARILVTGGAGFIGSHLVDHLLQEGFDVTVLDNLSTGRLDNLAPHLKKENFHFVNGDIRNFPEVKQVVQGMDAIFHQAALVSVPLSMNNPLLAHDVNVTGTLNLLKASIDLQVQRFIYASSAAIYGDSASPPIRENMLPAPTSPYGTSKLMAEQYVQLFHHVYGLDTVSLRYFNVYGPRQRFDIHSAYGGALAIFTNRLIRSLPPIIYGDGEQTRDFVYIQNVIDANIQALKCNGVTGDVFNIGTGTPISVNQVAAKLKELLDKQDLLNVYMDPQPGDIRHSFADIEKSQRLLGYDPSVSLDEGLTILITWYTKNRVRVYGTTPTLDSHTS